MFIVATRSSVVTISEDLCLSPHLGHVLLFRAIPLRSLSVDAGKTSRLTAGGMFYGMRKCRKAKMDGHPNGQEGRKKKEEEEEV